MDNYQFILKVLDLTGMHNGDMCGELFWRTDGEYAPVTFLVNCNDVFCWGCADCERITPDNIHLLEEALAEVRAASPNKWDIYADMLFCCKARKMRPQGCCYPKEDRWLWPLLDACGPPREVGLGNPYEPGKGT